MSLRHVTLIALSAMLLGAGATAVLLARQQPGESRRIPQFENEHVKVWKSIIMPKQPLTLHRHEHPRALIALVGGSMKIVQRTGETEVAGWETGKAYWLTADPPNTMHADVNDTDKPIEVIVVELKNP